MNYYVTIDMEGITGIPDDTFVDSSQRNYPRGQKLMTAEANAVVEQIVQSGHEEVVVNDSHSKMNNILIEDLHPEARLITGDVKPYSMMQGLEASYSGAFFLGYHARAGQPGVLSHSMVSAVRNFYLNDHIVGELGLNAYLAGYYRVPVLMVSGDDQTAQEALSLIPNITTAVVKESMSRSSVKTLHPKRAAQLLSEKTRQALANKERVKPLVPPEKPELKIEFCHYGQAEWAMLMPGAVITPGTTTVAFQASDMLEAYQAMLVMTELASRASFS
ncbi:M55 family metallopeptidase [Thalassobacillus sp. CUG 92003]|uniref:M55 family metallopeptidase n=1 Tax=Thalassobacillus sp. CUG 92003 TaxID=2736641 RepID=UPI0015E7CEA9|nr:M55 family metallopeptidase [Thalassobacillus sp. CUG 92003]